MHEKKFKVMDFVYLFIFKESIKIGNYQESMELCQMIQQSGTQNRVLVTSVMNFYNKCGQYETAIEISRHTNLSETTCYNCLIQSYIGNEDFDKAISLVEEMKKKQIPPNATTFTILITECSEKQFFQIGQEIINSLPQDLIFSNSYLISSIMNFYNKCGQYEKAIEIAKQMKKGYMDVAIYNCLIHSYIGKGYLYKAIQLIEEMKQSSLNPSAVTFTILITACANSNLFEEGKLIHQLALKSLRSITNELSTSIINFYTKCGHSEIAIEECEKLKLKGLMNIGSWNSLIQVHFQNTKNTNNPFNLDFGLNKAMSVFHEMKESSNIKPDKITYLILMTGRGEFAVKTAGLSIVREIILEGMDAHEEIISVMIYFYSRIANHETAQQLFEDLVWEMDKSQTVPSIITYNNMFYMVKLFRQKSYLEK